MERMILNIAELCTATRALGPGLRAAIWVQGCPIHCKGCIAPEWIPIKPALQMEPVEAARKLLTDPKIVGITISGGEPTLQAAGLAEMIGLIRQKRNDLHIICFTGYGYEELILLPAESGIHELLSQLDLLIDGPYIQSLNTSTTFAGSSNQRMITLSGRPVPNGDIWEYRKLELHIRNGSILTVGVPPKEWDKRWITVKNNGFPMNDLEVT
jgi:anaerobic ribonucleoside-triphosphate reductase activating protein